MKRFLLLTLAALSLAVAGAGAQEVAQTTQGQNTHPCVLRENGRMTLLAEPAAKSKHILTLTTFKNNGKWYSTVVRSDGPALQEVDTQSVPDFAAIGDIQNDWIRLRVIANADTLYGYVDRPTFEANMELRSEEETVRAERFKNLRDKVGNISDFDTRFPLWILILLAANFVGTVVLAMAKLDRVRLAFDYLTMLAVFVLELLYIVVQEGTFWWCEPEQMGWFKAILFFLVTLGLAVWQFKKFFYVINTISEHSRPFNTWVGVTLFTAVTVVMLVYAIFTGGLDDEQNRILIYVLVGTQALQMVISAAQLRRYPLYALMVLVFIPLGTFAVLLSFLRMFAILCFFAIIWFVMRSFAAGQGGGASVGAGGGKGGYIQEGDSIKDANGIYYDRMPDDQGFADYSGFDIVHWNGAHWKRR